MNSPEYGVGNAVDGKTHVYKITVNDDDPSEHFVQVEHVAVFDDWGSAVDFCSVWRGRSAPTDS